MAAYSVLHSRNSRVFFSLSGRLSIRLPRCVYLSDCPACCTPFLRYIFMNHFLFVCWYCFRMRVFVRLRVRQSVRVHGRRERALRDFRVKALFVMQSISSVLSK